MRKSSRKPPRHKPDYPDDPPPPYSEVMKHSSSGINHMHSIVENCRTGGGRNRVIVAIVNRGYISRLESKYHPAWWKRLVSDALKPGADTCPKEIVTPTRLQRTIEKIEHRGTISEIIMIAHESVPGISFHIASSDILELQILRCPDPAPKTPHCPPSNLVVDGASTFCGTRLDEWELRQDMERSLYLGQRGVLIRADPSRIPGWDLAAPSADATASPRPSSIPNLSGNMIEQLKNALDQTIAIGMGKSAPESWAERWELWKGAATLVLELVTAAKVTCEVDARVDGGGIFVKIFKAAAALATQHTFEAVGIGTKFAAIATGAGPAVALGAATAVAVYFIPWEDLFRYLGLAIRWIFERLVPLLGWFRSWWEKFTGWIRTTFGGMLEKKSVAEGDCISRSSGSRRKRHRKSSRRGHVD
ncbi:hypothetical protein FQN53_002345 [Emmonsiellopsis sp. PD_33]|nr:hypothetical protein FQN53_002345 [Emmonsiellopsis sp. PD_33]